MEQSQLLVKALKGAGAALVGFGDVSDLPAELTKGLPVAVSIAVKYDRRIADNLHLDEAAYHGHLDELQAARERLMDLAASMLSQWRYKVAVVPGDKLIRSSEHLRTLRIFPHKTAATRAGLGWIGKCALLVTPGHGPRFGLATVLTSAPFPTAKPVTADRCGKCDLCVRACPYGAIFNKNWRPKIPREELFDAYLCNEKRAEFIPRLGRKSSCGLCLQACPVGKKSAQKR